MSWTFDVESQSLYVALSDEDIAGQVEMPDGTIVDIDVAGAAVGIEVLRAWASWDIAAIAAQFDLSEDTAKFLGQLSRSVQNRRRPRGLDQRSSVIPALVPDRPRSSVNADLDDLATV